MSLKKKLLAATAVVASLAVLASLTFFLRPVEVSLCLTHLREPLNGFSSQTVTVEGQPLHYLVTGPANGPAVVLVHGLGGSAEDWLHLAPYLTRAGYRVYMPDLLGYGRSPRPADFSYSVRDEAAVVVGFLDALDLKQVDLAGWSMGGWIAQLVAIAYPERVHKLVLFDSVGLYHPPDWNTGLFTPANADELNQLEALLVPDPPRIPAFVVRDILRVSEQRAWVIHRAVASMMTGNDTTDNLLPTLKMPVLLGWGSVDRATPLNLGNRMQTLIPHAELAVAESCGHMAPRDCTQILGPRVVAFLQK
jgi:pimeloyl-ACP methyl ester carboxylesterase